MSLKRAASNLLTIRVDDRDVVAGSKRDAVEGGDIAICVVVVALVRGEANVVSSVSLIATNAIGSSPALSSEELADVALVVVDRLAGAISFLALVDLNEVVLVDLKIAEEGSDLDGLRGGSGLELLVEADSAPDIRDSRSWCNTEVAGEIGALSGVPGGGLGHAAGIETAAARATGESSAKAGTESSAFILLILIVGLRLRVLIVKSPAARATSKSSA